MYIDPPYPQNGCNYKHNMQDWEEHRRLAMRLANTKCKWILSSYDRPEVREMYDGYGIISIQSFSGMNTEKNGSERVLNQEVLIANFDTQTNDLLQPSGGQMALQKPLLKIDESKAEYQTA